jgi:hypothetical protein
MTSKKKIQSNIPGKPENPFTVPQGYFNYLGDRVIERIRAEGAGAAKADGRGNGVGQEAGRLPEGKAAEKATGRVQEGVGITDRQIGPTAGRKISMRPYLTLAASISGIALIIYILLQTIVGGRLDDDGYYDLALLDRAGVIYNEAIIAEAYSQIQESPYSEWDKDAMVYLSSNEVDLIQLLDSN